MTKKMNFFQRSWRTILYKSKVKILNMTQRETKASYIWEGTILVKQKPVHNTKETRAANIWERTIFENLKTLYMVQRGKVAAYIWGGGLSGRRTHCWGVRGPWSPCHHHHRWSSGCLELSHPYPGSGHDYSGSPPRCSTECPVSRPLLLVLILLGLHNHT